MTFARALWENHHSALSGTALPLKRRRCSSVPTKHLIRSRTIWGFAAPHNLARSSKLQLGFHLDRSGVQANNQDGTKRLNKQEAMQIGRSYCPVAVRMADIVRSQKEPKIISNEFMPKPTQRVFGQCAAKAKMGSDPPFAAMCANACFGSKTITP